MTRSGSIARRDARSIPSPATAAAGFTLVEVMVALVIISIGLLALVSLVPLGSHQVATTTQRSRASQLASSRAERLLITPYADEDLTVGSHTDDENPLEGAYYVSWTVEDDAPITGCKRVVVKASMRSAAAASLSNVIIVVPRSGG